MEAFKNILKIFLKLFTEIELENFRRRIREALTVSAALYKFSSISCSFDPENFPEVNLIFLFT